ncbi:DMT family transporter [Variovorax sp. Sphag1AA]|uniref:DMT family transporter n=1 Tax=Variovorax sp. Sphag1AA TaxID=2587027 RepID=UPI001620A47E|nr:DMT family transporter [Variovorax sp. Sphag1AA]MBB3175993.1 drug/metabolite transporter (DMT)-like permease [Variovorax sp. Sphag1AA]
MSPTAQRPAIGGALLTLAMAAFAVSDSLAKQLAPHFPAFALAWFRYLALLITVLPLVLQRPVLMKSGQPLLQALRAIALAGSAVLFLYGLRSIPQAEATAMVFASPLFVVLLARLVLHERLSTARVVPVLMGFIGVLVVARPGTSSFGGAEFFPLFSSMAWASAVILTRKLGATDGTTTTMFHSALIGVLCLSPMLPAMNGPMPVSAWLALASMCVAWCAAQWLVVSAYRIAPPSAIAPLSYSQMLWAGILGWAVFGHWPDTVSLLGMGIIALSAMYAAWRAA